MTRCVTVLVPEENNDEPQNFDLREGQGGNADCLLFSRVVVDVIYFYFDGFSVRCLNGMDRASRVCNVTAVEF